MTPLTDFLRKSTRERHARMEALPFIAALVSGELPLNCYVAQLRALAVIHATLETELRRAQPTRISLLYQHRPSRLSHLRMDLSVFDPLLMPDCLKAVENGLQIAAQIRTACLEQPDGLPGFLYVLEGTTLGNSVHLRDVERAFGERVRDATHYYAGYGDKTGERWDEFQAAMNALPLDEKGREGLLGVVYGFFDRLERLYTALHPVEEGGWGFTAGMLNPEAGSHSVPKTAEEIKAAVTAARRCREEFPYFDERYGERGGDFAKSDAAWLVSFSSLPQAELISQVEWLGRVLSNRGMPRITLERQLELLHEELISTLPAQKRNYDGLLEAAARLKSERLGAISEEGARELTGRFHSATHDEQAGRFIRAGELIVSAVCDEKEGIPKAVESLISWLTDPKRFSAGWIDEVIKTTKLARNKLSHP